MTKSETEQVLVHLPPPMKRLLLRLRPSRRSTAAIPLEAAAAVSTSNFHVEIKEGKNSCPNR